jgi:ribosomal protein S18 acetylase RimI-like enzyme
VGRRKILATRILKDTGMRKATYKDRERVVSILLEAFKNNKSVNYIAGKEEAKIRYLMEYSFDNCMDTGEIYISDNGIACAMIQFHDRKKSLWKSILLDIQLILKTIGVGNIRKALARESFIKKHYPKEPFTYLWFVGVIPERQRNGFGSEILKYVLDYSKRPSIGRFFWKPLQRATFHGTKNMVWTSIQFLIGLVFPFIS